MKEGEAMHSRKIWIWDEDGWDAAMESEDVRYALNHAVSTPRLPTIIDARPNAIVDENARIANYAHPLDSPPSQCHLDRQ
jgi:hypothetical protein